MCLLNFLPVFLPSLLVLFLLIYFLTCLLPDLSIYFFQNRPLCFCCVCFSFSVLSQEIGWEERLQNDLFCIGWDVKS